MSYFPISNINNQNQLLAKQNTSKITGITGIIPGNIINNNNTQSSNKKAIERKPSEKKIESKNLPNNVNNIGNCNDSTLKKQDLITTITNVIQKDCVCLISKDTNLFRNGCCKLCKRKIDQSTDSSDIRMNSNLQESNFTFGGNIKRKRYFLLFILLH